MTCFLVFLEKKVGKEKMNDELILSIKGLKTYFFRKSGVVKAVDNIDLDIQRAKITAVVGESGSGKSVTAMSVLRLIDEPGKIVSGDIILNGKNIANLSEREMMSIRGKEISMIFQDPSSAMNPVVKVKKQLWEAIKLHDKSVKKQSVFRDCVNVLKKVGLKNAEKIMESYPFELSGGMCQRVMVAMALLTKPALLIADEPTTAIDLTIQAAILDELVQLKDEGMSIMLITHDLGVVAQTADYVYVMHNGKVVEHGTVFDIFEKPVHPYTKSLLKAIY